MINVDGGPQTDPCPHCGSAAHARASFCPICGQPLQRRNPTSAPVFSVTAVDPAGNQFPATGRPRHRIGVARTIVVFLIALATATVGILLAKSTDTPSLSGVTSRATAGHGLERGKIAFGLNYHPGTLRILNPRTRFTIRAPELAYSAMLTGPVAATSLGLHIASRRGRGVEETVVQVEVAIPDPKLTTLADKVDLAGMVRNTPGTYVARFVRGDEVIAEGTFELIE